MSSRRIITIEPDGKIMVIRGYKVAEVARAAGLKPTYSASAGGWMLDADRLPELVAWLEYRNFRYVVEDDTPPPPRPRVPAPRAPEREPTLW